MSKTKEYVNWKQEKIWHPQIIPCLKNSDLLKIILAWTFKMFIVAKSLRFPILGRHVMYLFFFSFFLFRVSLVHLKLECLHLFHCGWLLISNKEGVPVFCLLVGWMLVSNIMACICRIIFVCACVLLDAPVVYWSLALKMKFNFWLILFYSLHTNTLEKGMTLKSKPAWEGMDSVRLSCPGHTTATTAAVHMVPFWPNGLWDLCRDMTCI